MATSVALFLYANRSSGYYDASIMPYEYRRLTPQEREKIIELRRQRGYPLHAPPHPYRANGTFLITAANFEHKDIMHAPERRAEFQQLLLHAFHEIEAVIIGWVILPNHYHILAGLESLDSISNLLRLLHGRTSHDWNLQDGLQGKRKVWYRFSDRLMRDVEAAQCGFELHTLQSSQTWVCKIHL